jgi:hypothetical protein
MSENTPNLNNLTPREKELVEAKSKIEAILTQYKAALVPVTLISGTRVFSRVDVVPAEAVEKDPAAA